MRKRERVPSPVPESPTSHLAKNPDLGLLKFYLIYYPTPVTKCKDLCTLKEDILKMFTWKAIVVDPVTRERNAKGLS